MRPDTVVVDTALAVPDSLPPPIGSDTLAVADSLAPPERLPSLPDPVGRTALPGVHVWERADLFRSGAVTLGELLARTPGVQALDIGYYAAPQALAGFAAGAGAGAVEVVLDGYPLDPLVGAAIDIARLPLVQLERVRLERRADRIRVELETVRPIDPRPYTVVEAQAGEPFDVATFRGLFVAPNFVRGPLAVAFERVGSDGVDGAEPADLTNMWLRWSFVSDSQGVQLEFLNSETGWSGELPFTGEQTRRDLV
ncbi:MAG: TonB-dependent receptor plug domain-containing protein, partial [Longimicrobiales bacterium]